MFGAEKVTKSKDGETWFIDSDFKNIIIEYKRFKKLNNKNNFIDAEEQLKKYLLSDSLEHYTFMYGDYYKNDFFEYIDILKESYSFNILNMYEMDFDDSCFVDLQHLGTEGSIKATRVICEYLKDIIELKGEDVF